MEWLKRLTWAALIAGILTALAGVGAASATVLCSGEVNTSTGACTQDYPAGTAVVMSLASGTSAQWVLPGGEVWATCSQATMEWSTASTGGSTSTVSSGSGAILKWGGCTNTTPPSEGEFEIHWIPNSHNGTLTGKGFSVAVGGCSYTAGAGTDFGVITGSMTTAMVHVSAALNRPSIFCPKLTLIATFSVTTPTPMTIGGS